MANTGKALTRIGVFYDGNYFFHVSNYYQYEHPRNARIGISGLHDFICQRVASEESLDPNYCQVVDAHYFRGRLSAEDAEKRDVLLKERKFDDALMHAGVTTHYLPLGAEGEKGIDVWLALEVYELAFYKRFDMVVLIAGDGDFLPLIRKLNTLGIKVMLLAWDFRFKDNRGSVRETRTAQALLNAVTYPVLMHQVIDDRTLRNDRTIDDLFLSRGGKPAPARDSYTDQRDNGATRYGTVHHVKDGFGFITPENGEDNLFFFAGDVVNTDFEALKAGAPVTFEIGANDRGPCAVNVSLRR